MSASIATPFAPASTSRSRSRPPRGAVGLGHFPEDDQYRSSSSSRSRNRTRTGTTGLLESLARSLSRPGRSPSTSPPTRREVQLVVVAPAQTRDDFIAANGGQPWGALGMGSPSATSSSSAASSRASSRSMSRGRQASSWSASPRREWSVSRREWTKVSETSDAAVVATTTASASAPPTTDASRRPSSSSSSSSSRSRSTSRAVMDKVRGIMTGSRSVSPRGVTGPGLVRTEEDGEAVEFADDEEKQPIVTK
ncbi:hypothetical protein JCM3774_001555 [Rhodotorula dairenensis]